VVLPLPRKPVRRVTGSAAAMRGDPGGHATLEEDLDVDGGGLLARLEQGALHVDGLVAVERRHELDRQLGGHADAA